MSADKNNVRVGSTFRVWYIAGALLCVPAAWGEDIKDLSQLSLAELTEIPIVSAARHQQSRTGSPRAVSVITAEEIRRRNFRNVPEAVGTLAGVYLQQTNYGGGSPIIRGMVGNRILLMVNGIRLNNATYRLGPNQYLNSIDINTVERIEVVRGAGSVLYGSDAFGGVINVITKQAPDSRLGAEFSGSARVRFATADTSGAGHIELSGARGRLGFSGGFTMEQFGDLWAGGNRGVQPFTGYEQGGADFSVNYAVSPNATITAGITRLKQTNLPRTDLLADGSELEYQWEPQGLDLFQFQYSQNNLPSHVGTLQVTLSYQRPFEYLSRVTASDPYTERRHADVLQVAEAGVQLTTAVGNAHMLTYGLTAGGDWVGSTRTDIDIRTGVATKKLGNYSNGSRSMSVAFFLQDEVRVSKRLDAVLGIRHDDFDLHAGLFDPVTGPIRIDSEPGAVTGSGHLLFRLTRHWSLTGGVSQGFRAPNMDDSTILSGVGSRFEIPNAKLKPERSVNLEYGARAQGKTGNLTIVAFHDTYRDLIDRAPGILNGLSFVDLNNNLIKDGKEPDVYKRQNVSRAVVDGLELSTMLNIAEGWTWTHSTTWTRGTEISLDQPLARIPPLNGASRITWQSRRPVWIEGVLVAAAAQHRLSPADKTDVRIGPAGTAGYAVFHLRAGFSRSLLAGFSIALENITNRQYRFHGSGFDRPGTSLSVGYVRPF